MTWNSSTDCCSWLGVTCSSNGCVVGLDLSRESISCSIDSSSSLFQLQNLQSLNLAYNDFNGSSIPSAIGRLADLRYLNLTSAYFSGQIPFEVARLTRLVTLDFSKSGKPLLVENPNLRMLFQNFTELVELYLYSSVDLSTQGSDWCEAISSSLPHLRVLSLSGCSIRGPLCESLANLQYLYEIDLSYNSFNSPVPGVFANLSNLTYLSLSSSKLLGTFPKEIFQIPSIQTIDLSYNDDLHGSFPEFPNNGSLRSLIVDSTSFSGDLPNSIGNLKAISTISLSRCSFTGFLPKSIENLTQLVDLDIAWNRFSSPISSIHWENLVNLESLHLSYNQLYGTIPSSVVSLPKLRFLTLSHNRFSGQVPDVSNTSSYLLDTLDLENNNLEGQIPTTIFNLQGLAILRLSSNNFSGFPFNFLHHQPINLMFVDLFNNSLLFNNHSSNSSSLQIKTLVLASNKLRAFPGFLRDQITLDISSLNLSGNQIQGEIPNWIFSLKSLTSLDLSCNSLVTLEAPLPNSTSALSSLDLHSNKLVDIPSSYSFLQLDSLVLASNKLKTFPDFLRNQSTLYTLDLSDNQIQGQIPNWIWSTGTSFSQARNLSCNSLDSLEAPDPPNSTYIVLLLDLHSNLLQGQIPLFLSGHYMDYSRNNFNSSIPNEIGDFIYARSYLSLSSSNLHGHIPKSICNASGLVLDLSNNSLSGNIPQCLTEDIPLQSRVESRNKLDQAVFHTVMDLSRNKLTGSIPDNFQKACRLETLDLSRNQIQGQFPKSLINCSSLVALNLGNNFITDTFPCVLMNISTLGVLVLRSNKFHGSIGCPNTNDTWSVLQVIDLAHNSFSGEMAGRMFLKCQAMVSNKDSSPTNLEYPFQSSAYRFDLPDSFYRDAITAIIKGLEFHLVKISNIFTLVDFSSNKFSGSIPEEIGELKSLYVLNLSNNAFTGRIPSSFGQMQQLESLDLSSNQLSGTIPQQMAKLSFLAVLDLSNNQLVGRIPTGTQFSTFPRTSFEGNKGLWGPPLTTDALLPPPTSNGSSTPPSSGNEIDWNIISAEIGFTCGFGLAVGSLLFCKRWRKWYYRAMRSVLFKIFPPLEQRFGIHRRHVYINTRH
uniref:receptor-like protein 12 n=1 Tax=Fragaria vesca subsp. vesca TaxID=101020 RepID=UPI0005CA6310|nr:PREDICTED: receptor-like protein 12 [Fragaria vesca subsp. vesca]